MSTVDTSAGARNAAARTTAESTGLRLCGMVEEPPRPGACGSNASPISVCIISDTSRAIFPSEPTSSPSSVANSATRSRWVCHGESGNSNFSSSASAAATAMPLSPSAAKLPAAPPNCSARTRGFNCRNRTRCRSMALNQPATLRPKVTGSACCINVRPAITVRFCASASAASDPASRAVSASNSASAARSCNTSAVSIVSWLVVPQCTKPAASVSCALTRAVRSFTKGMAGLPAVAVARASASISNDSTRQLDSIARTADLGITPTRASARARAAMISSMR